MSIDDTTEKENLKITDERRFAGIECSARWRQEELNALVIGDRKITITTRRRSPEAQEIRDELDAGTYNDRVLTREERRDFGMHTIGPAPDKHQRSYHQENGSYGIVRKF